MKTKKVNPDIVFYLRNRNLFTFSGKYPSIVPDHDKNGIDGLTAFGRYDAEGKVQRTRHPAIVARLLQTKASVNFQIKQWAEGRADGTYPRLEFDAYMQKIGAPEWVSKAVNNQLIRLYKEYMKSETINNLYPPKEFIENYIRFLELNPNGHVFTQ